MSERVNPEYTNVDIDVTTGELVYSRPENSYRIPYVTQYSNNRNGQSIYRESPNAGSFPKAGAYPGPSGISPNPYGNNDFIYNSYAGVDITAVITIPGEDPLILGELQTISYSIHRENTPVRHLGHTNVSGFVKGPRSIAGSMIFTVFNNYAFYRLRRYKDMIKDHGVYSLGDMLPPFDIVLSFANEYGMFSVMKIYGVSIIDEGGTMSVDDLMMESTYTYMARGIQPIAAYRPTDQFETSKEYLLSDQANDIRFGS